MLKISGNIGINFKRFLITRAIINANSGGGKSWLIRWLLEQTHGEVQQIVLDLEGEFSTLREKYDYLLVGQNGDIPVSIRTAELLARKVLELNVSTIIDLSELKHAERITFVKRFLDSMINAPKELWHEALVVVDEAHQFCPEKGHAESASAVIDLMTRGRKRGFCGVLATQRISKLHKDAIAEANNYFVGRAVLDIDAKRAGDILGFSSKEEVRGLRDLKAGEFYVFGTAFNHSGIERVQIGKVSTTHDKQFGSRASKPSKTPDNIKKILSDVADLPKEAEEELRTTADLKKKITELKGKLTLAEKGVKTSEMPMGASKWQEHGKKYGYADFFTERAVKEALIANDRKWQEEVRVKDRLIAEYAKWLRKFDELFVSVGKAVGSLDKAVSSYLPDKKEEGVVIARKEFNPPIQISKETEVAIKHEVNFDGDKPLRAGARKMLNAIAGAESLTKQRLGTLVGFKITGGTFNTYISELKSRGWIEQDGNTIRITPEGLENAEPIEIPTGRALLDMWMGKFRQGAAKILEHIYEQYPNSVSKEDIGAVTGFVPSGGTFNTYISELKSTGLIKSSEGGFVASDEFFQ